MSIYAPLQTRLSESPLTAVTLSFEEIEAVLGRTLPKSARDARIKRQWWANTDTHVQARAWLKAGRKARLNAHEDAVTFVNIQGAEAETIVIDLAQLDPATVRGLRRRAERDNIDLSMATARLLDEAAGLKRAAIVDWYQGKSTYSDISSAELIREDRDAR